METNPVNKKLQLLRQFLQTGELLLWHGAPEGGLRLLNREKKRIPYTLFLLGLIAFLLLKTFSQNDPENIKATIFLYPISAVCLLFQRFLLPPLQRRNCYYGITNQRVILMKGKQLTALPYDRITELGLERHKGQLGTIHLTPPVYETRKGQQVETDGRLSLFFVSDCFRVYDLIEAQKSIQANSASGDTIHD